ncbi:MAG: hypothetical protein QQN63_00325 [Nitrosopumilus sp.]
MAKKKSITTLIDDCDALFKTSTKVPEDLLDWASSEFREVLKDRFAKYGVDRDNKNMRLSQSGKELRLLHLEHLDDVNKEFPPNVLRLFLYGDLVEILMVFMAKLSGHTVTNEQMEVTCAGVKGHIDGIIDGNLVDEKSASGFGYKKFANGDILNGSDPYGYIGQLGAYQQSPELKGLISDTPYLWVMNKENGEMCLRKVYDMYLPDMAKKIEAIKEVREPGATLPPMCANSDEVPAAKTSLNKKIGSACTYCDYKWNCWEDLRAFKYSNRTEYLSTVVNEPRVDEVTHELRDKRKRFNRKD